MLINLFEKYLLIIFFSSPLICCSWPGFLKNRVFSFWDFSYCAVHLFSALNQSGWTCYWSLYAEFHQRVLLLSGARSSRVECVPCLPTFLSVEEMSWGSPDLLWIESPVSARLLIPEWRSPVSSERVFHSFQHYRLNLLLLNYFFDLLLESCSDSIASSEPPYSIP